MNFLDYILSLDKTKTVAGVRSRGIGIQEWRFNLRKVLFQWEVEELGRLNMFLLNAPVLRLGRLDNIRWIADKFGLFTVASTYNWNI